MKVLGVSLFLFVSCIVLSISLDMIIGKTMWQSILSLRSSFALMGRGETQIFVLFLLSNFAPAFLRYMKRKKKG